MTFIKTIAACAVVALGVGATSATASSLLTSANIKNGTIKMRDLSPSLQAKIERAGTPGAAGAKGETGATGHAGVNGRDGQNGTNGTNGTNGRDGVRFDRISGNCVGATPAGNVSIANGVGNIGLTTQNAYGLFRMYPKNMTVNDLSKLSFKAQTTDAGVTYLKITTTGNGSIVFDPFSQEGDEAVNTMVEYNVLAGTSRFNDDAGESGQLTWAQIKAEAGSRHVKEVSLVAGCAQGLGSDNNAEVQVDDLTVNNEVIDFS
jgi:hypothetical protein